MTKFRIASILAIFLIVLSSCNSKKSEQETVYKEVISIHDEVMPKMEEVSKLNEQLKAKAETIARDSSQRTHLESIRQSINTLQKTSADMMDWMHNFNSSYDTLSEDESIKYLKEEKLKIQKVKDEMDEAIKSAKENI